jgi:hypothetical protein
MMPSWVKRTALFIVKILVFSNICLSSLAHGEQVLIDYETLTHELSIEALRSGNHDPSGENEYVFLVEAFGLTIQPENRNKTLEQRPKVTREAGSFGNVKLPSLSYWKPGEETDSAGNQRLLAIDGTLIRELTSEAMRTFSLPEEKIAILIQITMFEKNKKFILLGEDLVVGKASYYVVPEKLPHVPDTKDKNLEIKDDKGTNVSIKVSFKATKP